jgi:hypothetical protein
VQPHYWWSLPENFKLLGTKVVRVWSPWANRITYIMYILAYFDHHQCLHNILRFPAGPVCLSGWSRLVRMRLSTRVGRGWLIMYNLLCLIVFPCRVRLRKSRVTRSNYCRWYRTPLGDEPSLTSLLNSFRTLFICLDQIVCIAGTIIIWTHWTSIPLNHAVLCGDVYWACWRLRGCLVWGVKV